MNVRTDDGNVCHGFLDPENEKSLEHQGTLDGYLALEPNLLKRFSQWRPNIARTGMQLPESVGTSSG